MHLSTLISATTLALPFATAATLSPRAPVCYGISGTIERAMGKSNQILYSEGSFTVTQNGNPVCHFSGTNKKTWMPKDKKRYFESGCGGGTVRLDIEGKWFAFGTGGGITQDVSHNSNGPNAQGIIVTKFWRTC